jgi:hypothetical protein
VARLRDDISLTTDLFEHREVKPHFINPCCFGEDFATWLLSELVPLRDAGFELSAPIQEDYGWGLWCRRGKDAFWIALGYCGDGPTDEPAEWAVSVDYDPGLNLIQRLFHKPDDRAFRQVRDRIWESLRSNRAIEIVA